MSLILEQLKYTKEHEWVKVEGSIATVGISDYAQSKLGDIVFVELPELGQDLSQNEAFCVVESVKAASDVYSPLSGTVEEVNEQLADDPGLINQDAYTQGWIAKVNISELSELESLMSNTEYEHFLNSQEVS